MALPDRPAERHRQVAGLFTDRVRGARSWDTPSPVPSGADIQTKLLGFIGRDPFWTRATQGGRQSAI